MIPAATGNPINARKSWRNTAFAKSPIMFTTRMDSATDLRHLPPP